MKYRLRYLVSDSDRHENVRFYVRVPGRKKVRIYGTPLTNDFMRAYHEAISGADCDIPQAGEYKPGSFRHLCIQYFSSHKFKSNDPSTRNWQRRTLESICAKHGAKPVAMMASRHV